MWTRAVHINCYTIEGKERAMDIASRRNIILLELYRKRSCTIAELAEKLGVSTRTIRRDIEALSLTEPIYTLSGRYGGGVYIVKDVKNVRAYITYRQLLTIHKLIMSVKDHCCYLSDEDLEILKEIIKMNMLN